MKSNRTINFFLTALTTTGIVILIPGFSHESRYDKAIQAAHVRAHSGCLPGQNAISPAIHTPVDSPADIDFMKAGLDAGFYISMSSTVTLSNNTMIPIGKRVSNYQRLCQLDDVPDLLKRPRIIEEILAVIEYNQDTKKGRSPLEWYTIATAREVGEKIPEDVEPFRLYGDVGKITTVQDIQWALFALNIPNEIKTDNNGEQFVQVDPFLEDEASTEFMKL